MSAIDSRFGRAGGAFRRASQRWVGEKRVPFIGTRLLAGERVCWGDAQQHTGRVLRVLEDGTADVIEDGAPFRQWRLSTRLLRGRARRVHRLLGRMEALVADADRRERRG